MSVLLPLCEENPLVDSSEKGSVIQKVYPYHDLNHHVCYLNISNNMLFHDQTETTRPFFKAFFSILSQNKNCFSKLK